eukprot:GHVS01067069.1.p1 GENE.GHVS01067069.1~~GHVS01067069.1.p1  ORF type:complete len:150 (+),score=12.90 GHVS01067069.1:233-682(+)
MEKVTVRRNTIYSMKISSCRLDGSYCKKETISSKALKQYWELAFLVLRIRQPNNLDGQVGLVSNYSMSRRPTKHQASLEGTTSGPVTNDTTGRDKKPEKVYNHASIHYRSKDASKHSSEEYADLIVEVRRHMPSCVDNNNSLAMVGGVS